MEAAVVAGSWIIAVELVSSFHIVKTYAIPAPKNKNAAASKALEFLQNRCENIVDIFSNHFSLSS